MLLLQHMLQQRPLHLSSPNTHQVSRSPASRRFCLYTNHEPKHPLESNMPSVPAGAGGAEGPRRERREWQEEVEYRRWWIIVIIVEEEEGR